MLARVLYYSKDIENFGTGLRRIADACKDANVKYEFRSNNYGFLVIFYRPPLWASDKLEENLRADAGGSNVDNFEYYVGDGNRGRDTDQDANQDTDVNNVTSDAPVEAPVSVPVSVPVNVPENVPENVPVNRTAQTLLAILSNKPTATYDELTEDLGLSRKTIQRNLRLLKDAGLIKRVGSDKSGYWDVTGG